MYRRQSLLAIVRLQSQFPRLRLIQGPVHASWLNQIEIYFSIIQRKVLSPNDFSGLDALAERLLEFQYHWEATANPSSGNSPARISPTSYPSAPMDADSRRDRL